MRVSSTTPTKVEITHRRLLGLITAVAALAATLTWALSTFAIAHTLDRSSSTPVASSPIPSAASARASTRNLSVPTKATTLALSPMVRDYLKAMTPVCSVVMCPPNQKLATRLRIALPRK